MLRTFVALALVFFGAVGCSSQDQPRSPVQQPSIEIAQPDLSGVAFFRRPNAWAAAQQTRAPLPMLVFLKTNPWLMVIGSDSPQAALYDDGRFIYRVGTEYRSVLLSSSERDALVSRLQPASLPPGRYDAAAGWTDQPDNNLLIYTDPKPKFISVYGNLDDGDVRKRLPVGLVRAFRLLSTITYPDAQPWFPAKIEVMISPYAYAPDRSIMWPKRWPGLHTPTTKKRGGGSFSLFIPSSELSELQRFLANRSERGAVQIDGKKWSASIRLPFPQEQLWMSPNPEAH